MEIILASASPRRQQLLELIGLTFRIVVSDVEEDNTKDMLPQELAVAHAIDKALDVSKKVPKDAVVIGADTIVVVDGKVFGKPHDHAEAVNMLTVLAGREHVVVSGVAVAKGETLVSGSTVTTVKFRSLSQEQIKKYVDSGEPMDKAGAYAIQGKGALFVESINGCYSNVVGLPLVTLAELLGQVGVHIV